MNLAPAFRRVSVAPVLAALALLPGCAVLEGLKSGRPDPQVVRAKEQHAAFRAEPGWRKKIYRDEKLLARAPAGTKAVEISLREQRGLLLVDEAIAMDFPVATGRSTHPTPKGSYKILEKKKDHASNLYGRIVSGEGATVVSDADTRDHAVPAGGRFVGSPMPYWMRMTTTGVGMHVGHVPGHRPASHGCIRLKRETAQELFALLEVGTPVKVESFAPALGGPVGVDSVVIGEVAAKPRRVRAVKRQPPPAPEGAAVPPAAETSATPTPSADPAVPAAASPVVPDPFAPAASEPTAPEAAVVQPVPPATPVAPPPAPAVLEPVVPVSAPAAPPASPTP